MPIVGEMVQSLCPEATIIGDHYRLFDHPIDIKNTDSTSIAFLGKEQGPIFSPQGIIITTGKYCHSVNNINATLVIVNNPRKLFVAILNKYFKKESEVGLLLYFDHDLSNISDVVSIGENVVIQPGCSIGWDGFSYERQDDGSLQKFLHYGGVEIQDNVEIGSNTCIDRGVFNNTIIGQGTKIDNLCHIAHNVVIGRDCLIVAHSTIGGGVKIGDRTFVGIGAMIKDGLTIGSDCIIGMGSVVINDVPDNATVAGNPAKIIREGIKCG
jgi:UDP-3-O-[3-hydroxymyristoyl] glucosamine N-acyltransferase